MNRNGHFVFGFIVAFITFIFLYEPKNLYDFGLFIFLLPLILFYAVLPDIDIDSSFIKKFITILGIIIILILAILGFTGINYKAYFLLVVIILGLIILTFTLKHRGFTHSLFSAVLFSSPFIYFSVNLFFILLFSYLSHLIVDREVKIV